MSMVAEAPDTTMVRIPIGGGTCLDAEVSLPRDARGIVLFTHGARNRSVAEELNLLHMGTVLADLLTPEEKQLDERSGAYRFDIGLLTRRIVQWIDWLRASALGRSVPIALFASSTATAAALDAAVARREVVRAVVSCGGRPDLAKRLTDVKVPTLLIVGGLDAETLEPNIKAVRGMHCDRDLEVVPSATHRFAEPGAQERVAALAGSWFQHNLR